jgi:sigma-B regulation protein RsbU (phosphoserine phosphatase)
MADRTGHVLVVDDNRVNRMMLRGMLQQQGHQVEVAGNGKEALDLVHNKRFDLVLLDIVMPELDGFQVLDHMKSTIGLRDIPIIMISSIENISSVITCIEKGAEDFLHKPYDTVLLKARIGACLEKKHLHDQVLATNAMLEEANLRMKRDLRAAAKIQQALLPTAIPETDGFKFAWRHRPCDELAGDTLNLFPLDHRHVGLYVLDVSGHGVPAALLSVTLSRWLSRTSGQTCLYSDESDSNGERRAASPAEVAERLNHQFRINPEIPQYFTLVYGVLDTKTCELRLVTAGNMPPIYAPPSSMPLLLEINGFPIGIVKRPDFEEMSVQLNPGDRVLFYTDGIIEAENLEGEQLGVERLLTGLTESRDDSLDKSLDSLLDSVESWRDGSSLEDDISLLAIEMTKYSSP